MFETRVELDDCMTTYRHANMTRAEAWETSEVNRQFGRQVPNAEFGTELRPPPPSGSSACLRRQPGTTVTISPSNAGMSQPSQLEPGFATPTLMASPSLAATSSKGTDDTSIQNSVEEVWYLKEITFKYPPTSPDAVPKRVKIITQNFNGSVFSCRTHEESLN